MIIKRTLWSLAIFIMAAGVMAQEIRFSGGFNTINPGNVGSDIRFDGGAGIQFNADAQFGDRIYVQPGLGFVMRNFDYTTVDPDAVELFSTGYRDNALRLSVLGGYRFIDEVDRRAFNIRGYFGPSLLIGMGGRFSETSMRLLPEENNAQAFLTLGTGLDYDIFFVDAFYDLALSNAFQDNWARGRMNMLSVSAGVRLRLLGRTAATGTGTTGPGPTFTP
jgi:hypothetical protein